MNFIYQLTYDPGLVEIPKLANFLTNHPQIKNWRVPPLPATIFFVSELHLAQTNKVIEAHMNGLKYILTYVPSSFVTGYCDQGTWDFINDPPVPKSQTVPNLGALAGLGGSFSLPRDTLIDHKPAPGGALGSFFAKKHD